MSHKRSVLNALRNAAEFLSEHNPRQHPEYVGCYYGATLDDGRIVWRSSRSGNRPPRSKVSWQRIPPTLYLDFAELAERTDEDIVEFAGRWGPLVNRLGELFEPIAEWRFFARLAAALVRGAHELCGGPACTGSDWELLSEWAYPETDISEWRDQMLLQRGIAAALNRWHNQPGISRTLVDVIDNQFQVNLRSVGVFGTILMQLAYTIAGAQPLSVCYGCGRRFLPKRHPTRGTRQYCPRKKCRQAALRDAARDYRDRKKDTRAKVRASVEQG